jgi:hypothetical protein
MGIALREGGLTSADGASLNMLHRDTRAGDGVNDAIGAVPLALRWRPGIWR